MRFAPALRRRPTATGGTTAATQTAAAPPPHGGSTRRPPPVSPGGVGRGRRRACAAMPARGCGRRRAGRPIPPASRAIPRTGIDSRWGASGAESAHAPSGSGSPARRSARRPRSICRLAAPQRSGDSGRCRRPTAPPGSPPRGRPVPVRRRAAPSRPPARTRYKTAAQAAAATRQFPRQASGGPGDRRQTIRFRRFTATAPPPPCAAGSPASPARSPFCWPASATDRRCERSASPGFRGRRRRRRNDRTATARGGG